MDKKNKGSCSSWNSDKVYPSLHMVNQTLTDESEPKGKLRSRTNILVASTLSSFLVSLFTHEKSHWCCIWKEPPKSHKAKSIEVNVWVHVDLPRELLSKQLPRQGLHSYCFYLNSNNPEKLQNGEGPPFPTSRKDSSTANVHTCFSINAFILWSIPSHVNS